MQGRPPAALGSGAYVAGLVGAVALLAGTPSATVAAVAVGGLCLGVAAGGLAVTRTRLLDRRPTSRLTGLALLALGGWVTWTGIQRGADPRYQLTIGSVFVAVVGWGVMVGGESGPAPTDGEAETLATLPKTTDIGAAADGRRRQLKLLVDVGVLVAVAVLVARAVVQSDPSSWLFAGLFLVVFLPGTRTQVRLTDAGLVTTRYVCWLVPFDLSRTPWTQIYGYDATDAEIRIATEFGPDLVYDRDSVADSERVVAVLDERVPRL